jgi:hypothetical protein
MKVVLGFCENHDNRVSLPTGFGQCEQLVIKAGVAVWDSSARRGCSHSGGLRS